MRRRTRLSGYLVAIALVSACSDSAAPTQPGQGGQPPPGPTTTPTSPTLQTLNIEGPASVPPGETAQLRATAVFTDGSSRDVTSEAQWLTESEDVLSVNAGLVQARILGEASVSAAFGTRTRQKDLVVVPAGTFRLGGVVREWGVGIVGARVEAVGGTSPAFTTTTDLAGRFRLYGVPADVEVRVTRDGFEPHVQRVQVTEASTTLFIEMVLAGRRTDMSGNYTVTIGGGPCAQPSAFPSALQTRTYTGVLRQDDRVAVSIELRGGAVFTRSRLYGSFQGRDAWFTSKEFVAEYIDYSDWWLKIPAVYPDIAERLPDGTLLAVSGQVIITPSAEGFSGTLDGALRIFDPDFTRVLSSCESKSHRFTLSR